MAQADQSNCGGSIPGNVKGPSGWESEQSGLGKGVHGPWQRGGN